MSEKEKKSEPKEATAKTLGNKLRAARELAGLSLRGAAAAADISSAYLSQIEAGSVKEPSPHILHRLAGLYNLSYADLMILAGFILPEPKSPRQQQSSGLLEAALRTRAPLTDDEREALAEYLAWYRSRHGQPPEER